MIPFKNKGMSILVHSLVSILAISLGRFLGAEGTTIVITGTQIILFGIIIITFILIFRFYAFSLKARYGFWLVFLIYCFFLLSISFYFYCIRLYFFYHLGFFFLFFLGFCGVVPGQALPLPSSEAGSSRGSGWTDFDLDVLEEPFSGTEMGGTSAGTETTSISINKPEGEPPFPRTNARGDPAGPSKVCAFPFQDDELIGGDCLSNVYRRLLEDLQAKKGEDLSLADYALTRYKAEDLFEVKVAIIRQMAPLDPEGDWDRRGAHALENARTSTGEGPLERLQALNADLERRGVQSEAFKLLQAKVARRHDMDSHSET